MFKSFRQLPENYQGIIFIALGSIVLLLARGVLAKGITLILVVFAIGSIIIGCKKLGLLHKLSMAGKALEKKIHHKK